MTSPSLVDLRNTVPGERQALILSALSELPASRAVELVSDHDPESLYFPLKDGEDNGFRWEYLESGPDVWRVAIARSAAAQSPCCGACGGS